MATRFTCLPPGAVDIRKSMPDGKVRLNTLQPGDRFGEMSLLDGQPRSNPVSVFDFQLEAL
ncbi:MAG: cyclic nucleotide-binding domain-containing protein [Chloroflexota bacterium]|nr:cyclic nucleotide-binding domain-containing protein [Chloroflexota bacterium]